MDRFNPKWIFIILGAVVVIELVVGVRILTQSNTPPSQLSSTAGFSKGKISLSSSQKAVKVGDSVSVTVEVTSPLPAVGVDMVAHFDPKVLQASDSAIVKGPIFSQFPVAKIEADGLIRISGISTAGEKGFSGKGMLASINFKAARAGNTTISLDFTKDQTADSNIVSETSKDLLEEVQNLEVSVK